jgi:hypothetical protein
MPRPRAVLSPDRLGGVLREIDAAHTIGGVCAAAMEEGRREADNAPRGNDDGAAEIVAEVPNKIVALFVSHARDEVAASGP